MQSHGNKLLASHRYFADYPIRMQTADLESMPASSFLHHPQTRLEALAVQNVGCSIFACKAVAELVASSQHLRQLHLFNNMSDNEVWRV
jgi:hypothetical protein